MARAKIILRFTYRNHLNDLKDYSLEFITIEDFTNYLRWEPERAMMIGYGPVDQERLKGSRTSNLRLFIEVDGKEIPMKDANDLAAFLDQNPGAAKDVHYQKKKP